LSLHPHIGPEGRVSALLRWLLIVPPGPKRTQPEEILYGLDQRPPFWTLIGISAQHVLLALMLSIYAVIAARELGLDPAGVARYAAASLFWLGVGTVLYYARTRITPGIPFVNIPSPISMATYVSVTGLYGPGAAVGAFVLANVVLFLIAGYLTRLRAYFPPEVTGVAVLMLGVSLIGEAVGASFGIDQGGPVSAAAFAAAVATLAGIIWASVWGRPRVRIMAVLIGTVLGFVVAALLDVLDFAGIERLVDLPLLALPLEGRDLGWPTLVPAAILPVFLVESLNATDQLASTLTLDKLNDSRWRRADMPMVARGVRTLALGNLLLAANGLLTSGSSSANLGLAHASGVMSRHVALVAGGMMMLLAFVPAVPSLIVLTPAPVVGALLIYTAAFMIVAGMDLILSRMLNTKRSFTVGISVVAGSAVYVLPRLIEEAPAWSQTMVSSGLTVAAISAVVLNMIFRIGVRQTASTVLDGQGGAAEVADFLEHWGKVWGARREVILRAGLAIGEAMEILGRTGSATGRAELVVRFDEVDLVCILHYPGAPRQLGTGEVNVAARLDADDDDVIEQGMRQVSALMVTRLADQVGTGGKNGMAELTLQFEH
jgi:xanthine/uracil permease